MRRQEPLSSSSTRLTSSAASIRSTNYGPTRSVGASLSAYRVQNYVPKYSPSSGSSASASSSSETGAPEEGTRERGWSLGSMGRSSSVSPGTGGLTRSTSISWTKPYQSPANVRTAAQSQPLLSTYASATLPRNSALPSINGTMAPSSSSTLRPSSRSMNPSASPPSSTASTAAAPRSRSTSALGSYRSINIAQLNKQAAERAERDEKDKQYQDWLDREKMREQEHPPPPPPVTDFRKQNGQQSQGYAQFARAVHTRSETAAIPESPRYPATTSTPGSSSSSLAVSPYKPVATVSPYAERERAALAVSPGFTGLRNIGNTCFMNATLQMIVNTIELRTYFLEQHYKTDINPSNPLGFKGRLADAFAEFMKLMWNGQHRAIEPVKIKELVAEKAPQFANFAQHDAHEFLSFLLDGLHEDLNRVRTKPYTDMVESDGRPDLDVSTEAWRNHTLRNDSIFVDLFHGQLKSRLQCPRCDRVSITFDPFVYLPVPFPKLKKTTTIYFWPLDPHLKPVKINVSYANDGNVQDLLDSLSDTVKVSPKDLRLIEAFSHRLQKVFKGTDSMGDICTGDVLYVFQVHSTADCHEEVVELVVLQRNLFSPLLRYSCASCGHGQNSALISCEACYNAYYCNEECKQNHWNSGGHRDECGRRPAPDNLGQPFVVSLPRSQLTYSQLLRVIEPRCRYSCDIFQTPQGKSNSEALDSSPEPMPPVPPERTRKSTSPSVSGGGSKRQTVLPERRKKQEQPMFLLRKLKEQAQALGDPIVDTGHPLDLPTNSFISVNWINVKNGKPYITVDNRGSLDIDTERTAKICGKDGSGAVGEPKLHEMLSMFAETERLKAEESWYCNKCKEHVEATKKLELYRLPPVLIVQLKRFVYTATYQTMHRRSKDERRVDYPLEGLDMAPYLAQTAPDGQETIYDLTGVVCHSGSSYFGHYISVGRLADFDSRKTAVEWRTFDDSVVNRAVDSAAQSSNAYLLFYKQRGRTTAPIFRRHYACDPTSEENAVTSF